MKKRFHLGHILVITAAVIIILGFIHFNTHHQGSSVASSFIPGV